MFGVLEKDRSTTGTGCPGRWVSELGLKVSDWISGFIISINPPFIYFSR